jgi:hypothetical protein
VPKPIDIYFKKNIQYYSRDKSNVLNDASIDTTNNVMQRIKYQIYGIGVLDRTLPLYQHGVVVQCGLISGVRY